MERVLYLGNKQFSFSTVKSMMETLEPFLSEISILTTASDKKNQYFRMLDMLYHFFRFGIKSGKIIIDVYSTRAFIFAFILGALSNIFHKKYILFLHGGNLPYRYQKNPRIVTWLFGRAHHIIAPSHYLATFFRDKDFNVQIIPNIIELKEYPYNERKHIRPRILAIRGFGKPYNPTMTLRAINQLRNKYTDITLLMLGNEDEHFYKDVLQFIKENKLHPFVEIRPKMPKNAWIALSRNFDIMVSNPVIDNTPVSIIEGMALGMCVVSTSVGGVPYLVTDKECGLLDSNDHEALADKIAEILESPDYAKQLSKHGRIKAEEFDWENIKPLWIDLLSPKFIDY
jgi:glycosyltransferase involved in cell wall biosynthesis